MTDCNASPILDDPRYVYSDDGKAVLQASLNGMDMGGWTDLDQDAFRAAVLAELRNAEACDPETGVYPNAEEISISRAGDLAVVMEFGGYGKLVGTCERPLYEEDSQQALQSDHDDVRAAAFRLHVRT